jgi:hypothetical protein
MVAAMLVSTEGSSFGEHSFLTPDTSKVKKQLLSRLATGQSVVVEKKMKKNSSKQRQQTDTHIFAIEVPDAITDKQYAEIRRNSNQESAALNNRLSRSDTVLRGASGASKCALSQNALIASFKSKYPPFGWTTYSLVRYEEEEEEDDDDDRDRDDDDDDDAPEMAIKFCSVVDSTSSSDNLQHHCVVLFKARLRADRTVQLVVDCQTPSPGAGGMSKSARNAFLEQLRELWKLRVLSALSVSAARVSQRKQYNTESAETLKRLKERKLDKVLHPDRYVF